MNRPHEPDAAGKQIGSVLVALQFVLIAALAIEAVLAPMQRSVSPWAWIPAAAGVLLGAWALSANGVGNFNIRPLPRPGGRLVRSGPYRFIRHPMYSAVLLCAIAAASIADHATGWGLCAALAIVLGAKAALEERWMHAVHPDYADYRLHSKRFVPFIW